MKTIDIFAIIGLGISAVGVGLIYMKSNERPIKVYPKMHKIGSGLIVSGQKTHLKNINTHRIANTNRINNTNSIDNITSKLGTKNNPYKPLQGGYTGTGYYKSWSQNTPMYVNSLGSYNNIYNPKGPSINITPKLGTKNNPFKPFQGGYVGVGYYKSWSQSTPVYIFSNGAYKDMYIIKVNAEQKKIISENAKNKKLNNIMTFGIYN